MNVLVTGGAGFIGSTVTAELLRSGHRVVAYDNLSRGHRRAVPVGASLVVGDVADRTALEDVLAIHDIEAVLHFAAFIEAGESMKAPASFFRNNTANALTLLEAMLARGVDKLVFSSTAALYGNPDRVPIEEDDPLHPTNAYGESKLLAERMLEWMNRIHGLRYASLRYFNAAGATPGRGEDHQPETHLIPLVMKVALGHRPAVTLFGQDYPTPDGTCVRDYIHVADLATAHRLALDGLAERDRLICNLGNGRGFSVRQVIEVARRVTGREIKVIESERRPGDPATLVASSARIQAELGWKPASPELYEIVESAWEWHRSHPDGYAD